MNTYSEEAAAPRSVRMAVCGRWATFCRHARTLAGFLSIAQQRALVLIGLLAILTGCLGNAVPVLLGRLVNALHHSEQRGSLAGEWSAIAVHYFPILLGVFILREFFQFLRRYLSRRVCAWVERDVTVQLTSRLFRTDLDFFMRQKAGSLRERMLGGVEGYAKLLQILIQELVPSLVLVSGAVLYCLKTQPGIGLVMLLSVPSTFLLAAWEARKRRQIRLAVHRAQEKKVGILGEQLNGLETIRAANLHPREMARVLEVVEEQQKKELQEKMCSAWFESLKGLHDGIFELAIITYAVLLTWRGCLEIGYIMTFWYLCFNILTPLRDIHRHLAEALESYLHVEDLKELVQLPPDPSFLTGQTLRNQPSSIGD